MDAVSLWERTTEALEAIPRNAATSGDATLCGDALMAVRAVLEIVQPSSCLELGSGRSTVEIARAAPSRFVSLDHERRYIHSTRRLLAADDFGSRVDLRHAPIVWCRRQPFAGRTYSPAAIDGTFDFVLIDGPPARTVGRLLTLPLVWPHLRVGGIVLLDDAGRRPIEGRSLRAWRRAFGPAIRVAEFTQFAKGLAIIQKVEERRRGAARAGWSASAREAAWTFQWRLRTRHMGRVAAWGALTWIATVG